MIAHQEFWGALALGAIIGGAAVDLFRLRWPHQKGRPIYRIEVYKAPAPAEPAAVFQYPTMGEALMCWNQYRKWETTHHIYFTPPDGYTVSFTNLFFRDPS
jgi:hypothetical protein